MQIVLVATLIGSALGLWTIGFQQPGYMPPMAFPHTWKFWELFLNLVSFSFGIDRYSVTWGTFCLLIIFIPIAGFVWKSKFRLSEGQWAILAGTLSLLAVHSSIAIGRANFTIAFAKNQEYAEHGMPLIILSIMSWSLFLQSNAKLTKTILLGLWLFCFYTFSNNWNFGVYRDLGAQRVAGYECVRAYYFHNSEPPCPTIYPPDNPLAGALDSARKLQTSFYQDMRSENEPGH
jgi:hypothetical protein